MRIVGKQPSAVSSCILYDPSSGVIHHIHSHVAYGKSSPVSQAALEARCREMAQKAGVKVEPLKFLHIDGAQITPGKLAVDIHTLKLLREPSAGPDPKRAARPPGR